jgi:acyl-CoA thioesterase FadM
MTYVHLAIDYRHSAKQDEALQSTTQRKNPRNVFIVFGDKIGSAINSRKG